MEMKTIKTILLAIMILGIMSCGEEVDVELQGVTMDIIDASQSEINSVKAFKEDLGRRYRLISQVNSPGSTTINQLNLSNFEEQNLQSMVLEYQGQTFSRSAIIHSTNPNISLNVDFDVNGEIESAFYAETITIGDLKDNKLYNMQGELVMHFTHNLNDHTKEIILEPNPQAMGWFDDLLDDINSFVLDTSVCLGELWTPTDIVIVDTAFSAAATVATVGWFIPASVAACGIKVALE